MHGKQLTNPSTHDSTKTMNSSVSTIPAPSNEELITSLRDWWLLAGVDLHFGEQPGPLSHEELAPEMPPQAMVREQSAATPFIEQKQPADQNPEKPNVTYPVSLDAFHIWLSDPQNLMEAEWSKEFALPKGPQEPKIMVITSMPEVAASQNGEYYSPDSLALLKNMLAALGCDWEGVYLASIALARPANGKLDQKQQQSLKNRCLHHMNLVNPQRIILLGDTASKIFFDQNLLTARKNKQFVNHVSSKTEAIATFHPRILLERPEYKAAAWKDLQLLTRTSAQ